MNQALTTITKNFINLVYPLRCAACKKTLDPMDKWYVCKFCMGKIRWNPKPYCGSCGRSLEKSRSICPECQKIKFHFKRAYSACLYEDVLKELIHLFKYNGKVFLSGILSKLVTDFVKENDEIMDGIDTVTCVPLGKNRLRKRGFNQSEVLARGIAKEFGIPFRESLTKVRHTAYQNELPRVSRITNLINAFSLSDNVALNDQRILLVDDVMTTGATLNECSRILSDGGAKEVRCLTLARGI